jgi:hypothetical protein
VDSGFRVGMTMGGLNGYVEPVVNTAYHSGTISEIGYLEQHKFLVYPN